eukprot:4525356-Prymnesium_polylepis.1
MTLPARSNFSLLHRLVFLCVVASIVTLASSLRAATLSLYSGDGGGGGGAGGGGASGVGGRAWVAYGVGGGAGDGSGGWYERGCWLYAG